VSDKEPGQMDFVIAKLRHAYLQLHAEGVVKQRMFADGLIAPAIEALERMSAIRADEAAKVRAETIEEAAKVAESLIVEPTATRDVNAFCQELAAAEMGATIAKSIRALGEKKDG
jgi:hypothetical protein